MRLLFRALFTLVLLGGLAFGSYAFGQRVLASKLFGNKGSNLNQNFGETVVSSPATRAANRTNSGSAIASVEVLPESGDSARPSRPTIDPIPTLDRSNQSREDGSARPGTRDIIGTLDPDSARSLRNGEASDTSERPRRRRRRRKPRATPVPEINSTTETPSRRDDSDSPDAVVTREVEPRNTPDEPARRAERIEPRREFTRERSNNSSDNTPSETPRRRRRTRTRTRVEEPSNPRPRAERIEPRREAPPRREESPVPRPEGGDGGESPVPVPE